MNPLQRQHTSIYAKTPQLQGLTLGRLPAEQERFRKPAATANLERPKILIPITVWHLWLRFDPESKLIEVGHVNRPIMHSVDQVLADAWRQIAPIPNLRHQLPKTIRPI